MTVEQLIHCNESHVNVVFHQNTLMHYTHSSDDDQNEILIFVRRGSEVKDIGTVTQH